jgi:hypothetical protein
MGIFTTLLTLPLAPVRGAVWVAEQIAEEADRQLYDESRIRRELLQLEFDHDAGRIDAAEKDLRAQQLLQRLTAPRPGADASAAAEVMWHG